MVFLVTVLVLSLINQCLLLKILWHQTVYIVVIFSKVTFLMSIKDMKMLGALNQYFEHILSLVTDTNPS